MKRFKEIGVQFIKQPIGVKHYSEMTNQELRDELAVMLRTLITETKIRDMYFVQDLIRQDKEVPIPSARFIAPYYDSDISIGLIKNLQKQMNLKDSDQINIAFNDDDCGGIDVVISFSTKIKETDLEYYERIKDQYRQHKQQDKVYKFISDVKKRTGAEIPYYQAKAAMEILESYKEDSK